MNRRFGAVVRWNIEPGASGGQNVQDAVEQPAGVTSGSADMRLCWGEVFLDNLPEIIVNFPEYHDPRFYLRGLIILGSPHGHEIFVTPEIWRHICVLYPDFYYPIINARWLLKKVVYVVNVDAYEEILKNGFDIEFAIRYFKGIVDEIGVFIEIRHSKVSSTTQPEQFYAFSRFDRKYRPFNSGGNGRHGFLQTQQPINPHRVGLLQKTLHRLQGNKLWSTLKGICDR